MTTEKIKAIAELNDYFRMEPESFGHLGRHFSTDGIAALSLLDQTMIHYLVATFEAFTEDNDPHGEHDCGSLEYEGHKVLWKIDYYNQDMTGGSEDPGDMEKTTRVLTTMLASEY